MKIINLGSSFAAGPGIPPQVEPKQAGRSSNNYAHLLARSLNCEDKLIDLSVSGATLLNISTTSQSVGGHVFPPQIEGVPEDADVVLVLGGGNDLGYITGMMADSWIGWLVFAVMGLASRVRGLLGYSVQDMAQPVGEEDALQRFGVVLDAIHARTPKARVIVVEYLTLLGPDVRAGVDVPFAEDRVMHHRSVAATLQRITQKAVADRSGWCEIVSTSVLSRGHGLGSEETWVWGSGIGSLWRGEAVLHPNGTGHEAVADVLRRKFDEAL